jgi:hypothetical protein
MAHAQKPDFVFQRSGRVHLNRQGRQFDYWQASCAHQPARFVLPVQACVLQSCDAYWLFTPFSCFPSTSPPARHRVPSHFNWTLLFRAAHTSRWLTTKGRTQTNHMLEYEAAVVRNYRKLEWMRRNTRSGSLVHDACLQYQQNFTTSALSDGDGVYEHSTCWAWVQVVEGAGFKRR